MAWEKIYSSIGWKNRQESKTTPVGATLLNRIDEALNEIDNRVIELNKQKAAAGDLDNMITNVSYNKETGVITFTKYSGSVQSFDLSDYISNIEVLVNKASASATTASQKASEASASATSASKSAVSAREDAERAEVAAKNAEAVSGVGIATETIAGLMAGGDNAVSEDGTLLLTKTTTDRTLIKSHAGGLKVNSIDGESVQDGTPSPDNDIPIKSVEISEIKGVGKNLWSHGDVSGTINIAKSFNLKAGTYAISVLVTSSDTDVTQSLMKITCEDGTEKSLYFNRNSRNTKIVNFTSNLKTVTMYASNSYTNSTGDTFKFANIQIEEGSTATDYEPYTEKSIQLSAPITLRGIGDVKDVLDVERRKILENICKFVINSSTVIIKHELSSADYLVAYFIPPIQTNKQGWYDIKSTHFTKISDSKLGKESGVYGFFGDNYVSIHVSVPTSIASDVTALKNWLIENEVEFYYALRNPIETDLSIADQIALHQLETFDTVTYISTDSEIEPVIEVEYGTSKVGAYAIKGMNDAEVEKLTPSVKPVNNLLATEPGSPLDAVMGKELNDKIVNFSTKEALSIFSKPIIVGCHGGMTIPAHGSFTQTSSLQHVSEKSLLSSFGITDFGDSTIYLPGGLPASVSDSVFSPVFCGSVISPKVDATGLRLINVVARGVEVTKITIINETDEDVVVPAYAGTHNLFVMFYVPTYHTATE